MNMVSTTKSGFTLIEILVAVAIVAIMGGIAIPVYLRYQENSSKTAARATLKNLKMAIDDYHNDMSEYPKTLKDLITPPAEEALREKWTAPYLEGKSVPKDPWGHAYVYQPTEGAEHDYELYSYGSKKGKSAPKKDRIDVWNL